MIANPPEEEEEEEILQTRIISPKEVARNWPDWLEAVEAEVVSLPEEKEALRRLTKEEHEEIKGKAESQGRKVEYIPSKVVFTVKPIPGGTKKKVRWVACGNFEPRKEVEENYSGGADSVAFRILVWAAAKFNWKGCVMDVKTAFLNAMMEQDPDEDVLLIKPPSIFLDKSYLEKDTVYLPLKAVYGSRRSPRLFKIKVGGANPKTLKLIQLESEPNLWKIVEEKKTEEEEGYWLTNATVLGLVMTFVDDIFVVGSEDVVGAVAQEIQSTWTVTEPEVVSEVPVRFLGMDILKVKEEGTEGWMINLESYVKDLVGRQVGEEKEKRIPISRTNHTWKADKDPPTLEKIRPCQKEVGEILWLVTRSRPDLMYATSRMGPHVTKATSVVLETARQA